MDPAVKELAELVGRVLAERWLKSQKEHNKKSKRRRKSSRPDVKRTTEEGTPAGNERIL